VQLLRPDDGDGFVEGVEVLVPPIGLGQGDPPDGETVRGLWQLAVHERRLPAPGARQPSCSRLQGPETYCDGTDNCATRDVTLTTAPGLDGMTGLGSVGSRFISTVVKF
jgi:hypothetical protein